MANIGEILILLIEGVGQTVGIRAGTEQPRYAVVERVGDVEIRKYAPRVVAETTVEGPEVEARNEGFRRVAAYIFGANEGSAGVAMTAPVSQGRSRGEAIAMTAPVVQARPSETIAMTAPVAQAPVAADGWVVQFFMPAKYALTDLPRPRDPAVRLTVLPAQVFAVLRFSGSRDAKAVASRTRALEATLADSGWRISGQPSAWFYDPPWTIPFLRRNEVAAPVARPGDQDHST